MKQGILVSMALCAALAVLHPARGFAATRDSASVSAAAGQANGEGVNAVKPQSASSAPDTNGNAKSDKIVDETESYRHSPSVAMVGRWLGMNPETAANAFEILNFLVLAGLVLWALAKSLPKMFGERTGNIQKQLVEARAATAEANERLSGVEQRLAKLDEEIAAIGAQAEKASEEEAERMRAAAEEDKNKIIAAAEQEISAAAANAQRQIRQFAAELAIDQAARRISINAETDRLLVQSFAGRLIGDDKAGQN